jgi:hypothetical protein
MSNNIKQNKMKKTNVSCDCCGKDFNYGETLVSINMNFESFEFDCGREFITVDDSCGLINLHPGCIANMKSESLIKFSQLVINGITENLKIKSIIKNK